MIAGRLTLIFMSYDSLLVSINCFKGMRGDIMCAMDHVWYVTLV
jgi:hypothetical protein